MALPEDLRCQALLIRSAVQAISGRWPVSRIDTENRVRASQILALDFWLNESISERNTLAEPEAK